MPSCTFVKNPAWWEGSAALWWNVWYIKSRLTAVHDPAARWITVHTLKGYSELSAWIHLQMQVGGALLSLIQAIQTSASSQCCMAPLIAHCTAIYYTFQPYTHLRHHQPASSVCRHSLQTMHHNHSPADPTKSKTQPKLPQNKPSPKQKEIKEQRFTFT